MTGRLVVVRRYLYRELASADEELLSAAGITPYLKGSDRVDLMVAGDDADCAKHLLESSPQLVDEWHEALAVPRWRCRSCGRLSIESRQQ